MELFIVLILVLFRLLFENKFMARFLVLKLIKLNYFKCIIILFKLRLSNRLNKMWFNIEDRDKKLSFQECLESKYNKIFSK